ncbi:hypothetical protein KJ684_00890 [Patescibacteria group bacterium]|nr:hypothetical protein [Patescibacteria group bacterium]
MNEKELFIKIAEQIEAKADELTWIDSSNATAEHDVQVFITIIDKNIVSIARFPNKIKYVCAIRITRCKNVFDLIAEEKDPYLKTFEKAFFAAYNSFWKKGKKMNSNFVLKEVLKILNS